MFMNVHFWEGPRFGFPSVLLLGGRQNINSGHAPSICFCHLANPYMLVAWPIHLFMFWVFYKCFSKTAITRAREVGFL